MLVVAGAAPEAEFSVTPEEAAEKALALMASGMSRKDAVRQVVQETGLPKNVVYDATLK